MTCRGQLHVPQQRSRQSLLLRTAFLVATFLLLGRTRATSAANNSAPPTETNIGKSNPKSKIPTPSFCLKHEAATEPHGYEILDEQLAYKRWRSILQRSVRMPNGNLVDFDVVGVKTGAGASIVFAWDTNSKTATLVKEYNPGCHKMLAGLAAGLVESDKHGDCFATAAKDELEEECHLSGENSQWYLLTNQPISMDKYSSTVIVPYLVLDPEHVEDPKPLDDEEDIEIVSNVSVDEILRMIRDGEMNVIGSWASLLAIQKLRDLGEIP